MPFFDEEVAGLGAAEERGRATGRRRSPSSTASSSPPAEYNRGPTAVLKNAIDYAYTEWNRKPVSFVGYGGVGGARAIEQLRLNAVELQMAPTRNAVHIVWADFAQVLQQGKKLEEFDHLNQAAATMLDDLAWWAKVLKAARENDAQVAQAA